MCCNSFTPYPDYYNPYNTANNLLYNGNSCGFGVGNGSANNLLYNGYGNYIDGFVTGYDLGYTNSRRRRCCRGF